MNISRKWLGDYVALDCDDATLCHKLTMSGIEVEAVKSARRVPEGVVTAKIMERKPHPDSDHLSVCQVFDGKSTLQIVCGAPNCDAGRIVPLATIGTVFNTPEGEFRIKKSKLRGVESNGMMCSIEELGSNTDMYPEAPGLSSTCSRHPGFHPFHKYSISRKFQNSPG